MTRESRWGGGPFSPRLALLGVKWLAKPHLRQLAKVCYNIAYTRGLIFGYITRRKTLKIKKKDLFQGAALTQIAEHESFKASNRASNRYGHYLINTDKHVFIKYRDTQSPYRFILQPNEIGSLSEARKAQGNVFLCLVCGTETVCALNDDELDSILDLSSKVRQWVRIDIPMGGSCHVSTRRGKLPRAITHSSFPEKLFSPPVKLLEVA
jgi:hypothetical protein